MRIRLARLPDVPAIYHLITQATQRGKILKRSLKEIEKAAHHFWVVEDQNKIIACCALEIYNKKLAEIRSLVVEVKEQKKGLATHLLNHCLKEAKKKKILEILAITDRINLFKRLGFAEQLHGQKPLFIRTRAK
ncbi:MAG: GNAT family N-acetyltransferase [Elusimicrobia bacterium]|nr:GNAT family N-acetyltransferase [Elusimicrobiota bacterium]